MNTTILNNSIVKTGVNFLTTTLKNGADTVVDGVKDNIPTVLDGKYYFRNDWSSRFIYCK